MVMHQLAILRYAEGSYAPLLSYSSLGAYQININKEDYSNDIT